MRAAQGKFVGQAGCRGQGRGWPKRSRAARRPAVPTPGFTLKDKAVGADRPSNGTYGTGPRRMACTFGTKARIAQRTVDAVTCDAEARCTSFVGGNVARPRWRMGSLRTTTVGMAGPRHPLPPSGPRQRNSPVVRHECDAQVPRLHGRMPPLPAGIEGHRLRRSGAQGPTQEVRLQVDAHDAPPRTGGASSVIATDQRGADTIVSNCAITPGSTKTQACSSAMDALNRRMNTSFRRWARRPVR